MKKIINSLNFVMMFIITVNFLSSCTGSVNKKQEVTIDGYYKYEKGDIQGTLVIRDGTWSATLRATSGNQVIVEGSGTERDGILYNEYNTRVGSANGTTANLSLPNGESVTLKKG